MIILGQLSFFNVIYLYYTILKKSQLKIVENFVYLLIITMCLMLVNIDNSNFAVAEWHMNKE